MVSSARITIGPGPQSWPQTTGGGDAVFEHPGWIAYLLGVDGPQELNPAPPLAAIRSRCGHGVEASRQLGRSGYVSSLQERGCEQIGSLGTSCGADSIGLCGQIVSSRGTEVGVDVLIKVGKHGRHGELIGGGCPWAGGRRGASGLGTPHEGAVGEAFQSLDFGRIWPVPPATASGRMPDPRPHRFD